MNWDEIEGNWHQFRGAIQAQWGKLTDDDLETIQGKREQLLGRLQQRYGMERERAERAIEDWMRPLHDIR